MLKDHQIKTLMLMHELEVSLGKVYEVFSEKFPEHNDLWETLIKEEQEHADAARQLYQLTYEGQSVFDEGGIKAEAIQSIIDYLKGVNDAALRGNYSPMKALSITCEIENTLVEKDFFSHFKVSPQYAGMLRTMDEGSKSHARLARKKLDQSSKQV
ncbi:MAG: hypothetical protein EPN25_07685 [Nitrospirae bacterium]|nr:MAG: hypothetical protein EPN25_07685 [Nitrospirota bacterium]